MKESIAAKLEGLCDRFDELSALLSDKRTLTEPDTLRLFSKEYAGWQRKACKDCITMIA